MHAPLRRFCIMTIPTGFISGSILYFLDLEFSSELQYNCIARLQCLLVSAEKVRERAIFSNSITGDTSVCTRTVTST